MKFLDDSASFLPEKLKKSRYFNKKTRIFDNKSDTYFKKNGKYRKFLGFLGTPVETLVETLVETPVETPVFIILWGFGASDP